MAAGSMKTTLRRFFAGTAVALAALGWIGTRAVAGGAISAPG
jgi:hypothetical protein